MQTVYRESGAQTDPWSPDYIIDPNQPLPEVRWRGRRGLAVVEVVDMICVSELFDLVCIQGSHSPIFGALTVLSRVGSFLSSILIYPIRLTGWLLRHALNSLNSSVGVVDRALEVGEGPACQHGGDQADTQTPGAEGECAWLWGGEGRGFGRVALLFPAVLRLLLLCCRGCAK